MKAKTTLWIALFACLLMAFPTAGPAQDYQTEDERAVPENQDRLDDQTLQQEDRELARDTQAAENDPDRKIGNAISVMERMGIRNGDKIPPEVMGNSQAVAIFPGMTKAGLIVGGSYGDGILMVRQNGDWNGPVFLSLYGASVGVQLGVESTDMVLVFMSQRALQNLEDGRLDFGVEASVTAGTYGRASDTVAGADVLSYQDTAGLFAGAALATGFIEVDTEAGTRYQELQGDEPRAYYSTVRELMEEADVSAQSAEVRQLADMLKQYAQQEPEAGQAQ
jgi:lipid-binding SYLF domain-containing protein